MAGYPGYYLIDTSPIEIVTFPKAERPGSTPMGRGTSPIARERTDLVHETEEGVLWVYPQVRRQRWRLVFRVSEPELEIFETLDLAVDGQITPFYFVPDVDASPLAAYLVRKAKDFDATNLDTVHYDGDENIPYYDYVLEMREESGGGADTRMTWDVGAYEYQGIVIPIPPDPTPLPDVVIKLKPGQSLKNVKISRRKRDKDPDLLVTVNKSTVVRVE